MAPSIQDYHDTLLTLSINSLQYKSFPQASLTRQSYKLNQNFIKNASFVSNENLELIKNIQKFLVSKDVGLKESPICKNKITAEYRTKMLDWLVEVTTAFKCRERTYFLASKLFDDYLVLCANS